MSTIPAIWTPVTPDERRHAAVAGLVSLVMSVPEGHRYASAYGILAGLVTSTEPAMRTEYAPEFIAGVEAAMSTPFNHSPERN